MQSHGLTEFACGVLLLDDWLKRQAWKNEVNEASRTFVVTDDEERVVDYYCLASGATARAESPKAMQRNRPDPVPVVVLGRLAVATPYQDMGVGSALLRDAVLRVLNASESIGIKAILVHAISEDAKRYYRSREFLESPVKPMTLCLSLAAARQALNR